MDTLRKNWFLVGLVIALGGAVALPGAGVTLNPGGTTTTVIVVLLFLVAGYTLPSEQVKAGLQNYRLHVYLQLFVFAIIPLYFFATARFFDAYLDGVLIYGLYALAVLPTTISTCVVFTQTTGGNTVGALFNSALANVAGILVSPLLLSLFLAGSDAALPPEEIITILRSLVATMLMPVLVGQYLRRSYTETADRIKKRLSEASSVLILLIVFMTVSSTAADPDFLGRLPHLAVPFAFLAVSHLLFVVLAYQGARLLGFKKKDRICAMYVGPQKTMAMGVPLLTVYFAGRPDILALALFPLLFYHPFQLLTAGFLRSLPAFRNERR